MTRNPDAFALLGELPDFEGETRGVHRDFDCLVLPAMTLSPAGVTALETLIAEHRNEVARYRLRTLDFGDFGIVLDECRDWVETLPSLADGSDPRNLNLVDWVALGRRLERIRNASYGGYDELRKLHALLTADEVPAEATDRG